MIRKVVRVVLVTLLVLAIAVVGINVWSVITMPWKANQVKGPSSVTVSGQRLVVPATWSASVFERTRIGMRSLNKPYFPLEQGELWELELKKQDGSSIEVWQWAEWAGRTPGGLSLRMYRSSLGWTPPPADIVQQVRPAADAKVYWHQGSSVSSTMLAVLVTRDGLVYEVNARVPHSEPTTAAQAKREKAELVKNLAVIELLLTPPP